MSVSNREIGGASAPEEYWLAFISKQMERLTQVASNIAGGGGGSPTGPAGGDLSGTYPNPIVAKILGNAIPINAAGALTNNGAGILTWSPAGTGSVTSVSVTSTNGFAGTVATATTTPTITISTTITGIIKGNGTSISAATVGTDYSVGTSALGTGILKSTTATGALSIAVAGDFPTLPYWSLATGGTLTNVNTITSNVANQHIFTGTWTASANNQNHIEVTGTITSRNTASDTINYLVIDPTIARNVGNPATQIATAVLINPTFSNSPTTQYILRLQNATTDRFTVQSDGTTKITNASGSTTFSTNGDIVMISGGRLSSIGNSAGVNFLGGRDAANTFLFSTSNNYDQANATNIFISGSPSFSYPSGTNSGTYFKISPTLNTSGGTNTIRIIDYNPTETLLTGSTHYFITSRSTTALSGFAVASPANAYIVIGAGTTTIAPFKLTSGTNLTTAVAGCMEYNGTDLLFTKTGTTRGNVLVSTATTTETVVSDTTATITIGGTTFKVLLKA